VKSLKITNDKARTSHAQEDGKSVIKMVPWMPLKKKKKSTFISPSYTKIYYINQINDNNILTVDIY